MNLTLENNFNEPNSSFSPRTPWIMVDWFNYLSSNVSISARYTY